MTPSSAEYRQASACPDVSSLLALGKDASSCKDHVPVPYRGQAALLYNRFLLWPLQQWRVCELFQTVNCTRQENQESKANDLWLIATVVKKLSSFAETWSYFIGIQDGMHVRDYYWVGSHQSNLSIAKKLIGIRPSPPQLKWPINDPTIFTLTPTRSLTFWACWSKAPSYMETVPIWPLSDSWKNLEAKFSNRPWQLPLVIPEASLIPDPTHAPARLTIGPDDMRSSSSRRRQTHLIYLHQYSRHYTISCTFSRHFHTDIFHYHKCIFHQSPIIYFPKCPKHLKTLVSTEGYHTHSHSHSLIRAHAHSRHPLRALPLLSIHSIYSTPCFQQLLRSKNVKQY